MLLTRRGIAPEGDEGELAGGERLEAEASASVGGDLRLGLSVHRHRGLLHASARVGGGELALGPHVDLRAGTGGARERDLAADIDHRPELDLVEHHEGPGRRLRAEQADGVLLHGDGEGARRDTLGPTVAVAVFDEPHRVAAR